MLKYLPTTRDVLAVLLTILVGLAFGLPWCVPIPKGAEQIIGDVQGALLIQWANAMSWYFGSSKSSAQKDSTIATMVANLPPPSTVTPAP